MVWAIIIVVVLLPIVGLLLGAGYFREDSTNNLNDGHAKRRGHSSDWIDWMF